MNIQMMLGIFAFVSFFMLWVILPTFVRKRVNRKYDVSEEA